jgi:hypothetical protein
LYTLSLTDWHTSPEQPEVMQSASDWHGPYDDHPQNFSVGAGGAFWAEAALSGLFSDALDVESDCGIKVKADTASAATAAKKKNRFTVPLMLFTFPILAPLGGDVKRNGRRR